LDGHRPEEVLGRLFGTSAHAKGWHISSARPTVKCAEDSQAIQRVRIDPRMRRAEEGKLFSQEDGLGGQGFFFSLTCPCKDNIALEVALDEAALLVAAARNVRQLGRSRRRGRGECTISLATVETDIAEAQAALNHGDQTWQDWLLERFDQAWMRDRLNDRQSVEMIIPSDIQPIDIRTVSPVRIRMIVRLDEPLLIAQRASAGNHYDTRSFIPGSVMMGAFAGKAAENCDLNIAANYSDFVKMFLRDGIKFSMLYPGYYYRSNNYPSIPAPLGLMTCSLVPLKRESKGHGIYSAVDHKECPNSKCRVNESRLEPVDGFLYCKNEPGAAMSVALQNYTFASMNDTKSCNRALNSYSAISDGIISLRADMSDETI
jgi:CRISPR-associated protein Csx10